MAQSRHKGGMLTFVIIWLGQLVSIVGTSMSRFALVIWVWQQTGAATAVTLIGVFTTVPSLLLVLVAGALVDRWDRKRVMMVSDLESKVPPDVQGRVFAARSLLTQAAEPFSMVLAGLLVDRLLEPAISPGGSLAGAFGGLVGVGPGAGMALLIALCGVLSAAAGLGGYAFSSVRNIEKILPDYDIEVMVAIE